MVFVASIILDESFKDNDSNDSIHVMYTELFYDSKSILTRIEILSMNYQIVRRRNLGILGLGFEFKECSKQ